MTKNNVELLTFKFFLENWCLFWETLYVYLLYLILQTESVDIHFRLLWPKERFCGFCNCIKYLFNWLNYLCDLDALLNVESHPDVLLDNRHIGIRQEEETINHLTSAPNGAWKCNFYEIIKKKVATYIIAKRRQNGVSQVNQIKRRILKAGIDKKGNQIRDWGSGGLIESLKKLS